MGAIIKRHRDENGNPLYYITSSEAVGMSDGSGNLDKKFSELDKKFNELNISELFPTQGIGESNKYDLATAIAQVPAEYRTIIGLKIVFINNVTNNVETWFWKGTGAFTTVSTWKQELGGSSGGNKIIEWNTNVVTTRNQVPVDEREKGMQISYLHPDNGWINEQYIGETTGNSDWQNEDNWVPIPNQKQITELANFIGAIPLVWAGNVSGTRLQVPLSYRKKGLQIIYVDDADNICIDVYIYNVFTDKIWSENPNWISLSPTKYIKEYCKTFSIVVNFQGRGKSLNVTTGEWSIQANTLYIDKLPVNEFLRVKIENPTDSGLTICAYNSEGIFIKTLVQTSSSKPVNLENFETDIKFISISSLKSSEDIGLTAGVNIDKLVELINSKIWTTENVIQPETGYSIQYLVDSIYDILGEETKTESVEFQIGQLNASTGEVNFSTKNYICNKNADFIPFKYTEFTYVITQPDDAPNITSRTVFCYDKSKKFISRVVLSGNTGTATLPDDTYYIRISLYCGGVELIEYENSFNNAYTFTRKGYGILGDVSVIKSSIGKPNGIATLGKDGKVLPSQLPDGIKEVDLTLNKESSNPIANSAVSVKFEEQNNRIKALEVSGGGSGSFNHIVYVTAYGAKGDGVNDDTSAIMSALDVVKNRGGGTLYFPATSQNVYLTRKGIVLNSNVKVNSDYGVILKNGSAVLNDHKGNPGNGKCYIAKVTEIAEVGSHTITVDNTDGLAIGQEITIAESTCGSYTETLADITAINGNVITFDTSRFTSNGDDEGIINTIDVGGYVLTDFSLIKTCMHIEAVNVFVSNIILDACGNDKEPYIYTISPINQTKQAYTKQEDFYITNVSVINSSQDGISTQGEKNVKISDCFIDNIKYKGIHWGTSCENVDIVGNLLYRCGKTDDTVAGASNGGAGALYYCVNNHRVTIKNNKILDCYRGVFGFDYRGTGETDTDTIVEGNYFENITKEGVSLKAGRRMNLSNNLFTKFRNNSVPIKVEIEGGNKLQSSVISKNIMEDFDDTYNNEVGDIVILGADGCIVSSNIIRGNGQHKINVNVDNSVIANNIVKGTVVVNGSNNINRDNIEISI